MPKTATRMALAGCLALVFSGLPQPPSAGEAETESVHPHREVLDQPPAETRARDDLLARSPGYRATVASYTSIQVNVDELGLNIVGDAANEPSIAVNPTDPDNMIIGWRQFDSISSNFRQAGNAYTTDRGQSWTFPGVLTPGIFRSDPVLGFDSAGTAFYQSLESNFDLSVFRSADGGMSWGFPVFAFGGDKNWMAIDRSGGIGDGNIYGIWQALAGCCGQNHFNRSENGGLSFEPPVEVETSPGLGTMAVGPLGEVYAAGIEETFFQDLNTFVASKSTNAQNPGATPTFAGVEVNLNASLGFSVGPNPGGLLGQINIAVDGTPGPSFGFVYVLASVDPNAPGTNPIDVLFSRSENGGTTWSPPTRVPDDPSNNGAWHWLAAFSVAPNGRLDAIWADTRNSGSVNISELFYSYSVDQGDSWSRNIAVSPSFNSFLGWPQQSKIGDYYTIISDATGADAAYAATFNGEQDVYYIRLFPDCNENGVSDVTDIDGPSSDCNSNTIPDECEGLVECGAAGATPDGSFVSGVPLRVGKAAGASITLTWSASCMGDDSGFGIYEGTVGDFSSHTARQCTDSQTEIDLVPATTSSYYLVVPLNGSHEGSYGRDGDGAQRPPGLISCRPQEIGGCIGVPGN